MSLRKMIGKKIALIKKLSPDGYDDTGDFLFELEGGERFLIWGGYSEDYTGESEGEYQRLLVVREMQPGEGLPNEYSCTEVIGAIAGDDEG